MKRSRMQSFSAAASSYITGLWSEGKAVQKWKFLSAQGPALCDMATATYLSLREMERKGFLILTVPEDLLDPNNLSRFQTERKIK